MTDLPTLIDLLRYDPGHTHPPKVQEITAALHAGGFTIPCDECHGRGWVVEGQTWDWPYGEQVQCGRCYDGLLHVGILPTPTVAEVLAEARRGIYIEAMTDHPDFIAHLVEMGMEPFEEAPTHDHSPLPAPVNAAQQDLARWKAEATEVLDGWEKVWMLLGCPGPLGSSKAANVWRVVRDLIEADEPGPTE